MATIDNTTREQLIENLHRATENLINMLPDTVPYHADTKFQVDKLPHESGGTLLRFTMDVVLPVEVTRTDKADTTA